MKKKTSGIDDLIKTLVKQHGLTESIDRARHMLQTVKGQQRIDIWWTTLNRLKEMR